MIPIVHREKSLFALLALLFIAFVSLAAFTDFYLLAALPFLCLLFCAGWHYKNFIFFLLLFSLPLSFEYHFTASLGTDIPDEWLMLLVSFLFLAGWIYSPALIDKKSLQHPLLVILLIAVVWMGLASFFSTHQTNSFKFLLAKSWYAGAFVLAPLILFREKRHVAIAALVLILSILIVVIIAIVRHQATGFSFASINDAVFPFFRNHVNYAAMLACCSPLLFAYYYLNKSRRKRFFIAGAILFILFALFFSYSRGAWLALIAGAIACWLIKRKMLLIAYTLLIGSCLVGLFWLKSNDRYLQYAPDFKTTIFHENFGEHLVATYKLKDVSTAERFYRWIAGVRMIKDNWLTGYGPNTFYENYKGYAVPAYKTWVSDNEDHSTVHNYFLLTAIEQGIPGLLFLLLLFGAMIWYAQDLFHRASDIFYKTAVMTIGVIVTMILVLNFLSDLIETDKIGSLFFLCIASLVAIDLNTEKSPGSSTRVTTVD